ncbi:hypothetical protein D3C81_1362190 [compost metagenome]
MIPFDCQGTVEHFSFIRVTDHVKIGPGIASLELGAVGTKTPKRGGGVILAGVGQLHVPIAFAGYAQNTVHDVKVGRVGANLGDVGIVRDFQTGKQLILILSGG